MKILIAAAFALLAFIYVPPVIKISNVVCKHKGHILTYENKESYIPLWTKNEIQLDCHFLSSSPDILNYGHDLTLYKSYPILINIWIAFFIYFGMLFLI